MIPIGSDFGNYKIEEKLGAGAMGVVYKAYDKRLKRTVALKLVSRELADSQEYRDRLANEAKATAKIDSPHVVKIWEHAEIDNQPYISMEYVAGEEFLQAVETSDFERKMELAGQIAVGLDTAHSQGVTHRDLKPDNIKTSENGRVKILDFGLAQTAKTDDIAPDGGVEGTLYYLSPEQISGEEITGKSDIFSFGVILYEIFAGRRPFDDDFSAAIIYSILHEDPLPPSEIKEDLPVWLDEIIMKCLAKSSGDRYENAREIINDFKNYSRGDGLPIALKYSATKRKVTVVDLKNLSGDENWEYFCYGFTEDLISELSRHTDLTISAEPSSVYSRNVQDIFKRCRSDFIITGSLMKWQDKIKMRLRIYGDNGENIPFSKEYETVAEDVFEILSEAAGDCAASLAEITGFIPIDVDDYFKTDIEAYEYYLKGKNYYHTNKPEELGFAEKMFHKALEIDSNLAYAYTGLSDLYISQYMSYYDRSLEKMELAKTEAQKALEIAPKLPEAHRALGRYYMFMGDFKRAENSFLKAIKHNEKYFLGYRTLGWLKQITGDHEAAFTWATKSLQLSPNDLETLLLLSIINLNLRKFTVALATLHRAIELAPDNGRAYYNLGMVYLKLGVIDLSLENFLQAIKFKGDPNAHIDTAYIYFLNKNYDKARTCLEDSIKAGFFPFIALYFLGFLERHLGNNEKSSDYLNQALECVRDYEQEDSENLHLKAYQAMSLAALDKREEANSILTNLEKSVGNDGEVLYEMARAYGILADQEKTTEILMKALTAHKGPTEKELAFDPHFSNLQIPSESSD
jgi:serine/threonine protein kinase/Flp pilus assembly protein TadD